MSMQEDDRKINSWWQSTWASTYIRIMIFGIILVVAGVASNNFPGVIRLLFIGFGLVILIASYFAAKSRWKKI